MLPQYIQLSEALIQLQIDPYTEAEKEADPTLQNEENYINSLIEVCTKVVENDINTELSVFVENDKLDAPLKHAILLMVRHMWENRSPVDLKSAKEVALSYSHLIRPYKNYSI
jgi:hypothetical protein